MSNRSRHFGLVAAGALLLLLTLSRCDGSRHTVKPPPGDPGVPPAPTGETVTDPSGMGQNWTPEETQAFWFTTQGSQVFPYEWFLALEQADSETLFRDKNHIERLRYIPARASRHNPDALPIGFARTVDRASGQAWVGFTCAACHTAKIKTGRRDLLIEGGPAMADFDGFYDALIKATEKTLRGGADGDNFARFFERIYGVQAYEGQRDDLFQDVSTVLTAMQNRARLNTPPHEAGYGRLDAFGNIFNQVLVVGLETEQNHRAPDAPVSYPFLWDTPQSDRVQWNGSASNAGAGALGRNVGEVLGVFGPLRIDTKPLPLGYPSGVDVTNLGRLEHLVRKLRSPRWPEAALGRIDPDKKAAGEALYRVHCQRCHEIIDRADPNRRYQAVMTPLSEVGTDPTMAMNAATRGAFTGRLAGTRSSILFGDRLPDSTLGFTLLGNAVVGVVLNNGLESVGAILAGSGASNRRLQQLQELVDKPSWDRGDYLQATVLFGLILHELRRDNQASELPGEPAYKARPLNGIWATAPYLHNGSVPNLWELLQPPDARVKTFQVGSLHFDAENVGFETSRSDFVLDTSLPGNSNAGHTYGTQLNDDQKLQLIEFIKSL